MDKIASTQELQQELRRLLTQANEPNPSRVRLASELRGLAQRVAAEVVPQKAGSGGSWEVRPNAQKATERAAALSRSNDALKALNTANKALSALTAMAENLEAGGVLPWGRANARTAYLLNTDVQNIMSRLKKFQQVLGAAVSAAEDRETAARLDQERAALGWDR